MIAVDIRTCVLLYLGIMLLFLIAAGVQEWWHTRVNEWGISEENLCLCSECHFTFVIRRNSRTARCPRCNKLCRINRKRVQA